METPKYGFRRTVPEAASQPSISHGSKEGSIEDLVKKTDVFVAQWGAIIKEVAEEWSWTGSSHCLKVYETRSSRDVLVNIVPPRYKRENGPEAYWGQYFSRSNEAGPGDSFQVGAYTTTNFDVIVEYLAKEGEQLLSVVAKGWELERRRELADALSKFVGQPAGVHVRI